MFEKKLNTLLTVITICLVILILKPTNNVVDWPNYPDDIKIDTYENDQVIPLGNNRIAIIDNKYSSGNHGNMTVLEFNEESKEFEKVSTSNYLEYIGY